MIEQKWQKGSSAVGNSWSPALFYPDPGATFGLKHITLVQALKNCRKKRPESFKKKVYDSSGPGAGLFSEDHTCCF